MDQPTKEIANEAIADIGHLIERIRNQPTTDTFPLNYQEMVELSYQRDDAPITVQLHGDHFLTAMIFLKAGDVEIGMSMLREAVLESEWETL